MSVPAYPEYKDSGVPWLGKVPGHWELTRIGSRFTERREKVSDTEFPPLSVTKNGIVPQLETAAKTDDNENRKCVLAGDYVINSRSDRKGSSGLSSLDGSVSLINTVISPDETMHGAFVHHLFRSVSFQEEYYRYGKGIVADLWSTNYGEMKAITLAVPPADEQQAIAAFLDRETAKIDALVAEQERLIALLKEKRQAVISHAVTKGLTPHTPMKDSGIEWLGEIPAHWKAVPMKHLVTFRSGGTPSKDNLDFWNGDIPWASAKDLKADVLTDTLDHLTKHAVDERAATLVPAGAVAVLVRGMMLARLFPVCELGVPMTINQDLKALLPSAHIDGSFLAWALRGTAEETLNRLDEAGHGTKALRMEAWTSMELPLPPLAEQADIVAHIRTLIGAIDQLAVEAQAAITLLQERRAALISAAVTGKIDVRGLVAPEDTDRADDLCVELSDQVGSSDKLERTLQ